MTETRRRSDERDTRALADQGRPGGEAVPPVVDKLVRANRKRRLTTHLRPGDPAPVVEPAEADVPRPADPGSGGPIRTAAGAFLRAAAGDEAPSGTPAELVDEHARQIWAAAFRMAVRRRFEPESPLAEITRTVSIAVHTHEAAALPILEAEMLVREALGETVPVDEIDPGVRTAVHLLLFASLADELALGDDELDALVAEAEELAA